MFSNRRPCGRYCIAACLLPCWLDCWLAWRAGCCEPGCDDFAATTLNCCGPAGCLRRPWRVGCCDPGCDDVAATTLAVSLPATCDDLAACLLPCVLCLLPPPLPSKVFFLKTADFNDTLPTFAYRCALHFVWRRHRRWSYFRCFSRRRRCISDFCQVTFVKLVFEWWELPLWSDTCFLTRL